ncbi:mechanosensitive ion channel family protein [Listeria booriae]|uniref:Mechanosensitive ion channel family protein n=2 Tax=Listeria booriae TaxID=1552123 RepID=A0A7X1A840_9LIST|nr:mechanosensitive ion channel family protein [Listeria booriae]MBC1232451.1 mechanosensitive ion channel family protein [Listeria booriae]MBC1246562.1 mechanosensitive ion channel family protein [Listeria booriae]MBC2372833.1 mechanosensitive ion channel family protein [Listeria booriae]
MDRLTQWFSQIDWDKFWLDMISKGISILILLILYFVLSWIGRKLIRGFFRRYRTQQMVSENRANTLESLILNLFGYVMFFTFAMLILQNFINVTAIIAGAGVASLAIAFGAQGLVSDVVTGFFILLERQLDVGDSITLEQVNGNVEALGLRTTQVRDFDGTLHFIPNRQIMIVSNHSRGNMRFLVDVRIAPTADAEKAMEIIKRACEQEKATNKNIVDGPTVLGVQEVSATNTVIRVMGKAVNGEQFEIQRNLLKDIREELVANQIELPLSYLAPLEPGK